MDGRGFNVSQQKEYYLFIIYFSIQSAVVFWGVNIFYGKKMTDPWGFGKRRDPEKIRNKSEAIMERARTEVRVKHGFTVRGEESEGWYIPRSVDRKQVKGEGVHYARSVEALNIAKFATMDARINDELNVVVYGQDRKPRPPLSTGGEKPYSADAPRGQFYSPSQDRVKDKARSTRDSLGATLTGGSRATMTSLPSFSDLKR